MSLPKIGLTAATLPDRLQRCVSFTLASVASMRPTSAERRRRCSVVVSDLVFPLRVFPISFTQGILHSRWRLFAGRIEESKGVFDILKRLKNLPLVEFALCGDGQALPRLIDK